MFPRQIFAELMLHNVRKLSKKPVKVYCWVSCSAAAIYTLFGPAGPSKGNSVRLGLEEEAARTGKPLPEVAEEVRYIAYYPSSSYLSPVTQFFTTVKATPDYFESAESLDALRKWFAETSREVYTVGPMLPPSGKNAVINEKKQSANSGEIDEFLERTLKAYGEQSLVYASLLTLTQSSASLIVFMKVSFGSVFWSVEPEVIWTLLDVLIEKSIPFIMSHGSPVAQVPDSVKEKVKASGLGLLSPWSPQQAILAHSVTGWFVTHCGFNSIMESLSFGVPMICWPYQADQPQNSIHLTENLGVAYELMEVRNTEGLKPIYRTGKVHTGTIEAARKEAHRVLDNAFGEDGAKKRAKAVELQAAFENVWDKGGSSRLALDEFLGILQM
ncbi:hypothetical protein PHLCEN_2v6924 [Hermanssonia centrifuga]|uniref:Uncharacterized protein n=1 Tax=Hermanssonia centrifuga TaxID=98765 RepID=A0A2R6NXX8_9APHY|nr:hypothetical protein PHLCEN_2v6924 [Hermanssonia centrifuga]